VLGLAVATQPAWADRAARDLDRVLCDHAHCEMKAASNALALSARCTPWPSVMRALLDLAEEELAHFRRVLCEIERRGLALGPPEEDYYAAELRRRASAGRRDRSIAAVVTDRLLVGALIEARSCERFKLLSASIRPVDADLAAFYAELFEAEARHHAALTELAGVVTPDAGLVRARLADLARVEAEIVRALPGGATIHG
jgi:tRNA-(ms[2]io[6]A)-hydroxylase